MTDAHNQPNTPQLDITEAKKFLEFLSPPEYVHCFQWMDKDSSAPISGFGVWYGRADEIETAYTVLSANFELPTLHIVLNHTNLRGRKKSDIEAARVFCVDLDREIGEIEIVKIVEEYRVQAIVRSSLQKYHLYWKCAVTLPLEAWTLIQAGLAQLLGGDRNLMDTHHCIRVPGVPRITKNLELFVPTFDVLSRPDELDLVGIVNLVPGLIEAGEAGMVARKEEDRKRSALARELLKGKNGASGTPSKETCLALGAVGQRNIGLFEAVKEYVLAGNGSINDETVGAYARAVNEGFEHPLGDAEVLKTAASGLSFGLQVREERESAAKETAERTAAHLSSIDETAMPPPPKSVGTSSAASSGAGGTGENVPRGTFNYNYAESVFKLNKFSDQSVNARVLQRFGTHLVRTGKLVYAFDPRERVWRSQKGESSLVHSFVDTCARDTITDKDFRKELCLTTTGETSAAKLQKWTMHFQSNRLIGSCVSEVLNSTDVRRKSIATFDEQEELVFVANGVLNMRTGELRDAEAEDYLLHRAICSTWNISAECPWWVNFISEVFAGNQEPQEMVSFMQQLFGYSLTGSINEQKIYVHYGDGCNGKSKVLECLALLLGDYSARLACNAMSKSKTALQKEFDRVGAKIEGKRVMILDDLDTGTQWNEGFIKNLTSPTIPARRLYEEERDIPNRAKFHLGCNTAPAPEAENYGILRRMCIIPYLVRFPQNAAMEQKIGKMMREELPGILKWAVEGWQKVVSNGGLIHYPNEVIESVEDYHDEHFTSENLIDSMFSIPQSGENWVSIDSIAIEVNARLENRASLSNRVIGMRLSALGFQSKRSTRRGAKRETFYNINKL